MEAKELRNFSVEELKSRIRQWREELFRSKFKTQSSEAKDTSVLRKLRHEIARGLTVLSEKGATDTKSVAAGATSAAAPQPVADQPITAKTAKAPKVKAAEKVTAETAEASEAPKTEAKEKAPKSAKSKGKKREESESK